MLVKRNAWVKHMVGLLLVVIAFMIGHDWPYFWPPNDFGVYNHDFTYKYVVMKDETRLCKMVSILDADNNVVFHAAGPGARGWYNGIFELKVEWSPCSYDLFVQDNNGSLVYMYEKERWSGPYWIIGQVQDASVVYYIHSAGYLSENEAAKMYQDNIGKEYPVERIPEAMRTQIYMRGEISE